MIFVRFRINFAPGSGDFDFTKIAPFVTKEVLLVEEAHAKCSAAEVREQRRIPQKMRSF